MLILEDHWIWDFWTAQEHLPSPDLPGQAKIVHHLFFLKAPKSLGDPELRHHNARIGHARSSDLRNWEVLPDALGPGQPGAFDSLATWTGSVLRASGQWHMYYTGVSSADHAAVQRIGHATSDDLLTWTKDPDCLIEADPTYYETAQTHPTGHGWRDPWVYFDDESNSYRMLVTARTTHGPTDERGVIGVLRSTDLTHWNAMPPLTEPGDFTHLEVPQLIHMQGRYYLLYSTYSAMHSMSRLHRLPAVTGTHYLVSESPHGPFHQSADDYLCGNQHGPLYAGRIVTDSTNTPWFFGFIQYPGPPDTPSDFVGAISDPIAVHIADNGHLSLDKTAIPTHAP